MLLTSQIIAEKDTALEAGIRKGLTDASGIGVVKNLQTEVNYIVVARDSVPSAELFGIGHFILNNKVEANREYIFRLREGLAHEFWLYFLCPDLTE